jgi:hypothetical protein
MSLVGVVRHLTEVEAYWLREVLLDEQYAPNYYCTPVSPDGDFENIEPATAGIDVATYEAELLITRRNAKAWTDLSVSVRGMREGEQVNLRWILIHLVEEYARSRSTPAISATWTFCARRSTAAPATDHIPQLSVVQVFVLSSASGSVGIVAGCLVRIYYMEGRDISVAAVRSSASDPREAGGAG